MANNNNMGYIGGSIPKVKRTAAKDFLSRAMLLNRQIENKLAQSQSLRDLAERASATLSDMPRSATRDIYSREPVIAKMLDLENEINADIDKLIDIKTEIGDVIISVADTRHQVVLEMRYLYYCSWDDIVNKTRYSKSSIHRFHGEALQEVEFILRRKTK